MKRRDFFLLISVAALARSIPVSAQRNAMPVIGFLHSGLSGPYAPYVAAFIQGLSDSGYVAGQNLAVEYRWAEGRYERLPELAADLIGGKVDLIVASGGNLPALAAKKATSTIPIVFVTGGDPIRGGLVASLARPGGNVTGITMLQTDLTQKRLELLSDLAPGVRVYALLVNPNYPNIDSTIRGAQEAARAKGAQLHTVKAGTDQEIDDAFTALGQLQAGALVVANDPLLLSRRKQLVALAAQCAIPAIYFDRDFAADGGLISYGTSIRAVYRLAGTYVGKILKGAKPADLPVQQPSLLELVINLTTAKALGLTVPQLLLAQADEVIE